MAWQGCIFIEIFFRLLCSIKCSDVLYLEPLITVLHKILSSSKINLLFCVLPYLSINCILFLQRNFYNILMSLNNKYPLDISFLNTRCARISKLIRVQHN